jgi:hypothetical protein
VTKKFYTITMDERDDGFFHYDVNYPPLCVRPPYGQQSDLEAGMEGVIISFLQDSYKDGQKDPLTILPSGISAGEAAVLYFREIHDKRHKINFTSVEIEHLILYVIHCIDVYMNINVYDHKHVFDKYINANLFQSQQYKKSLLQTLKSYLTAVNLKTKGYTQKLKLIVRKIVDEMS